MNNSNISKVYCVITLAICIVGLAGIVLTPMMAVMSLVIAVSVMGLPHGALDFAVAKMLGYCSSPLKTGAFMGVYCVIVALSVLFWIWTPVVALIIFLMISAHHFSSDWEQRLPYSVRLSLVVFILCGPSMFHADAIQQIFSVLMVSPLASQWVVNGMQLLTVLSISLFIVAIMKSRRSIKWHSNWEKYEIVLLLISSIVLPPLLHFTLYFCLLHSAKHLHHIAQQLQITVSRALWVGLPFVVLTIVAVIVLAQFRATLMMHTDLLQYVFIGLFGLTVAHMLLIELAHSTKPIVKH